MVLLIVMVFAVPGGGRERRSGAAGAGGRRQRASSSGCDGVPSLSFAHLCASQGTYLPGDFSLPSRYNLLSW